MARRDPEDLGGDTAELAVRRLQDLPQAVGLLRPVLDQPPTVAHDIAELPTAKAWVTNASITGVVAGLALVGALSERMGGHAGVVALLGLLPLALAPFVLLLPETNGRELEEVSGEAAAIH